MRSTMPFGKATDSRTQAARAGSWASARPATVLRATTPLCGMLSQESTVKGGAAGGAAGAEAGEDQAEDGLGRVGARRVGDDRRVVGVEGAGGGVDEVAALGDGQRDDAGGGVDEAGHDRRVVHRRQELGHHAGDARRGGFGRLLDDGGQPVLAGEGVAHLHVVGGDAGADDRPVAVAAGVHQPVEVDLEVGAVEVADAEVDDAGGEVGAGVASGGRRSRGGRRGCRGRGGWRAGWPWGSLLRWCGACRRRRGGWSRWRRTRGASRGRP